MNGHIRKGETVAWCRTDGTVERAKVTELFITEELDRVPAESAGPGEIIAIAGIPEITIGATLTDLEDPRPLPDRKSVVSGKSVSVRVDLGGRRIINKKK